ncbi:MAG: hypothetical protein HGGPFJEG_01462 [Ignavibacteria bacterium]|nr:hypothetical protein [Ignavibacteria bacterium]
MLKSTYKKFKEKYEHDKETGLLFISYFNFIGEWDKDKKKYIKMLKIEGDLMRGTISRATKERFG